LEIPSNIWVQVISKTVLKKHVLDKHYYKQDMSLTFLFLFSIITVENEKKKTKQKNNHKQNTIAVISLGLTFPSFRFSPGEGVKGIVIRK